MHAFLRSASSRSILIESPGTGHPLPSVCNRKRLCLLFAGSLTPARRIPAGRLPRGELLDIAFVFAKTARKYLKLVLRTQTVRYLLRSANPSRNKKFQPLVQIVRQGCRGQCVHAPGRFNGASTALPRRPSGLLEKPDVPSAARCALWTRH